MNSRPSRVFPLPVTPCSKMTFPLGMPPIMISSSPVMPVWIKLLSVIMRRPFRAHLLHHTPELPSDYLTSVSLPTSAAQHEFPSTRGVRESNSGASHPALRLCINPLAQKG